MERTKITRNVITEEASLAFTAHLVREEKAKATVEKYVREVRSFGAWVDGGGAAFLGITDTQAWLKDAAIAYKRALLETRKPAGINAAIAALNAYFAFSGYDIHIKPMKIQRQTYRSADKELTRAEYERLCKAARKQGDAQLCLIMQAICATGIRVSELRCITVEAARAGQTEITNKGKTRTVFISKELSNALLRYTKEQGIKGGHVFVTENGKPIGRQSIWAKMKKLCAIAHVAPGKVFPHNLRRLFARCFYAIGKDLARLADILGHSCVDTTRIYIMETGETHRKRIAALGLVSVT